MEEIRCIRCHKKLAFNQRNKVNWNPEGWLCFSCQILWTKLFFNKKLDKAMYAKKEEIINRIWRNFADFNPSYR